jgi:putative pyruvate formate lyase activating enzyme
MDPVYLKAARKGELRKRALRAEAVLEKCTLCPRECGVNRKAQETGYCRTGALARVASFSPHFGEESPLVGRHGSGTIFFSSCNLLCDFCQNFEISHENQGEEIDAAQLAAIMLALEEHGCHNINFVTPTHVVPQILNALVVAVEYGLHTPLVYNCGGYEKVETLRLLDGIVDIYMPDFKFWDSRWSGRYCHAPDYPEVARAAFSEMFRQVGDLVVDTEGIARHGLLVRHLVMPGGIAGTGDIAGFIAGKLSKNTYINIMDQYRPCGRASQDDLINRRLTAREYRDAVDATRRAGLDRLDSRERIRFAFLR